MRCPYSRSRPAREKRAFTIGEHPDGVYFINLCEEHARLFDRDINVWVNLADFAEMKVSPSGLVTRPNFSGEFGDDAAARIRALREKATTPTVPDGDVLVGPRGDEWKISDVAQRQVEKNGFTVTQILHAIACPETKLPNPREKGTFYFLADDCCVVVDPKRRRITGAYTRFEYLCKTANPRKGIAPL